MARLRADERNQTLGMLRAGMSTRNVANNFNCNQSTIVRLRQRFLATNTVADRPRPGAQRVTTQAQDQMIRLQHLRERFRPATVTARETVGRYRPRIAAQTVRRRLREHGLRARRPFKGPILTQRHRRQRLEWARGHLPWTRQRWQEVLFSDESRFNLSHADGRIRVWRRTGERYAACCIQEVNRWSGGSVIVWAGVSYRYKTAMHFCDRSLNAQRYRDSILTPLVAPMFQTHPDLRVYQQDNARPHTARISMDFLNNANIRVMPWPALSPDLAPIEHVWDELGRRVYSRPNKPTTVDCLRRALTEEWNNMPQTVIQNIILSMRRRCTACINARGGHTRY